MPHAILRMRSAPENPSTLTAVISFPAATSFSPAALANFEMRSKSLPSTKRTFLERARRVSVIF